MDPTSGGAGSSDTNSGEGPSSAKLNIMNSHIDWPEPIVRVQSLSDSGLPVIPDRYVKPPTERPAINSDGSDVNIPLIDLQGLLYGDDTILAQISEACREWGFFQILNHGISPQLLDRDREVWRVFFHLLVEIKQSYANSPKTYEGYGSRLGVEKGAILDCSKPHRKTHRDELVKGLTASTRAWAEGLTASTRAPPHRDELVIKGHILYPWAPPFPVLAAILSNQGESSGSGGRAGENRNGGGGDGNQGIGGGVGRGGQREGIGTGQRDSRGSSHGGGNGDDDDNDRRRRVRYIEDGRRPMDPRPDRMPEILLSLNVQIIGTLESLDVTRLSARARILRDVSLGFNSGSLVCLSASIQQRGTNPRLASILSWIGSVATFLGFISMIDMALLASFIP